MRRLLQALGLRDLARFCTLPGGESLTPEIVQRHKADDHWMMVDSGGRVLARCSLWWSATPSFGGRRLGRIGHYAAAVPEAATKLLRLACDRLAAQGCAMAVVPMDGNTWRRYRAVTERGTEPSFFLEPANPDDWPAHFTTGGFRASTHYVSALATDLDRVDPRAEETARRMAEQGIRIRPLAAERFDEELSRLYAVVTASFRQNAFYTPIGEAEFAAQYRALGRHIRPELVLAAAQGDRGVGFLFAIPDLLQARRGVPVDTVVVKTLAVHPDYASAGLGSLLVARAHETARQLGYSRVIHALMHEDNPSRRISAHYGRTIRRYSLFARNLEEHR